MEWLNRESGQGRMNRETSIYSSDTLVVTDRSRRRRTIVIAAAVGIILLALVIFLMMSRGGSDKAAQQAAAGGQVPTVTVVVPGQSQVGRSITASGPLGAKRDQPIGIAGSGGRVVRVVVDAGSWVNAGQVLAIVDRSVQAQQ